MPDQPTEKHVTWAYIGTNRETLPSNGELENGLI